MKIDLVLLILILPFGAIQAVESSRTPEFRDWEAKQVALWEDNLAKAATLPPTEKFEAIALGLRNMGHRVSMTERSPAVDQIYQRLQQEFLAIPGHATYYRDKINALRDQLLAGNLSLEDWDQEKSPYFRVLGHLPSEETVEVLCGFAVDDFAAGGFSDPKNAHIPGLKEWKFSDYSVDFTVCLPAMRALSSLQIDNAPSVTGIDTEKYILAWRQWWQEVKAGKRKYRFKGSSVEHPVNPPPGTFREQRRPESEPDFSLTTAPAGKPASLPPAPVKGPGPLEIPWKLIAGIAAFLFAMVFYLLRIVRRK